MTDNDPSNDRYEFEELEFEKARYATADDPTVFDSLTAVTFAVAALISITLGTFGAVRIVYGTFDPAITFANIVMIPMVVLLMAVMAVVWLVLIAAAVDWVVGLWNEISNTEAE